MIPILLLAACGPRMHAPTLEPPEPGIFAFTGNVGGQGVTGTLELADDAFVRSNLGQCRIPARDLEQQRRRDPRWLTFSCGLRLSLRWDSPSQVRDGTVEVAVRTETTRQGPCQRWEPTPQKAGSQPRCLEYQRLAEWSTRWVSGQVRVVRQ